MKTHFLIDIDSLFDIKHGILARINPDKIGSLSNKHTYHNRLTDRFHLFTDYTLEETKQFETQWANRTAEDLRTMSFHTPIVPRLCAIIRETIAGNVTDVYESNELAFDINYFPYKLTQRDIEELQLVMSEVMGEGVDINFINIDRKMLTPFFLTRYQQWINHDITDWFEYHHRALHDLPLPRLEVVFPALIKKDKFFKSDLKISEVTTEFRHLFSPLFLPTPVMALEFSFYIPGVFGDDILYSESDDDQEGFPIEKGPDKKEE